MNKKAAKSQAPAGLPEWMDVQSEKTRRDKDGGEGALLPG